MLDIFQKITYTHIYMVLVGLVLHARCLSFHKESSFILVERNWSILKRKWRSSSLRDSFLQGIFRLWGCSRVLLPVLILPVILSASSKEKGQMERGHGVCSRSGWVRLRTTLSMKATHVLALEQDGETKPYPQCWKARLVAKHEHGFPSYLSHPTCFCSPLCFLRK